MPKTKDLVQCKHPNSRKTHALIKQIKKSEHRGKNKLAGNMKLNLLGEKVAWFRDNLEPNCSCYNPTQALDLINMYLCRFDDELEQIKIKHSIGNRKNRQHASREDIINLTVKREQEEFKTCGFEVPDLLNNTQFNLLKSWSGELRFLQNFKFTRYSRKFLEEGAKKGKQQEPVSSTEISSEEKKGECDMEITQ